MRRIYSAYPGTGSVYSVIAKSGRSAVAYVPSLTYACSTVYWTDTCDVLSELTVIISHWYNFAHSDFSTDQFIPVSDTIFSKVLCAVIFFLGLFVCLCGHQFFKTETFFLGFLSGGLVFYIVIAAFSTLPAAGMKHVLDYAYCLFVTITVVLWSGYSQ